MGKFSKLQHKRLITILLAIVILSLVDGILTIYEVNTGLTHEANPILKEFIDFHPLLFALVKHLILAVGLIAIYQLRELKLTAALSSIMMVIYIGVICLHALGIHHAHQCTCWQADGQLNPHIYYHVNMHENHQSS